MSGEGPAGVRETVLGARSLYILPTRHGLLVLSVLAAMFLAGINYGNGLAYGLAFLVVGIALVGMLDTHRNLSGLRVAVGRPRPVFAGETAVFPVLLKNEARIERVAVELAGVDNAIRVPANAVAAAEMRVPAAQRGYVPAPLITLRSRYPLGIWKVWSPQLTLAARCLVYPRPAPRSDNSSIAGGSGEDGAAGEGDDFAGLRDYRKGDAPQHIAWKAVARGQGWQTKLFSTGAALSLWLDWDALVGLDPEARLSLLCRMVLDAEERGRVYGLRLPTGEVAPGRGEEHRDRCLERLALYAL